MILRFFITGIFIGICIALPFGGNTILCLRNTFSFGSWSGILTGLGAATAHSLYSLIGLSGVFAIEQSLTSNTGILECIGGIFLCYFGFHSVLNPPKVLAEFNADANFVDDSSESASHQIEPDSSKSQELFKTYAVSTLFALTNPKSILLSAIMITESKVLEVGPITFITLTLSILGIFLGSTLWWIVFVVSLSWLKKIVGYIYLLWIERFFSSLVILFGIFFVLLGGQKIGMV